MKTDVLNCIYRNNNNVVEYILYTYIKIIFQAAFCKFVKVVYKK